MVRVRNGDTAMATEQNASDATLTVTMDPIDSPHVAELTEDTDSEDDFYLHTVEQSSWDECLRVASEMEHPLLPIYLSDRVRNRRSNGSYYLVIIDERWKLVKVHDSDGCQENFYRDNVGDQFAAEQILIPPKSEETYGRFAKVGDNLNSHRWLAMQITGIIPKK